jgi:hypothetical protein
MRKLRRELAALTRAIFAANSPHARRRPRRRLGFEWLEGRRVFASLSGFVYVDAAAEAKTAADIVLAGVTLTLTGEATSGATAARETTTTAGDGSYEFLNLAAGDYTITETQPSKLEAGSSFLGTLGGTAATSVISNIAVGASDAGSGYNFREAGMQLADITLSLFLDSTPPAQTYYNELVASSPVPAITPFVDSIALLGANPTNASSVDYQVNLNEAVTGVTASAFALKFSGSVGGAAITSVSGSGSSYTVAVSTGSGSGTIGLNVVDDGRIFDAAHHALGTGSGATLFTGPSYIVNQTSVAFTSITSPIDATDDTAVVASGTAEAGSSITLTATDGAKTTSSYSATANSSGVWSIANINVSSLADGAITFKATATGPSGGATTATTTSTKTTAAPTVAITSVTNPVTSSNDSTVTVGGVGTASANISLTATDGTHTTSAYTATVGSSGTWTISNIDLSALNNGTITFNVKATGLDGATATATSTTTKSVTSVNVAITSAINPINNTNDTSVTISGTGTVGASISVVGTDGSKSTTASTTTVQSNGVWTITDIDTAALADGTITFTVTASNTTGGIATATATSTKNTISPALTVGSVTNPINNTNDKTVSIGGTGAVGGAISLTATDGVHTTSAYQTTVGIDGSWSIDNLDTSALADGAIVFHITITGADGNTATTTATATKRATAPNVTISSTTNPITNLNADSASVSGTGGAGDTISLVATNGASATQAVTTTVGVDGTWSITGLDLRSLPDGTITFTATDTNSFGSKATATATATSTATTISISSTTSPINIANEANVAVSGIGTVGGSVSLVASNGGKSTAAMTTTVGQNGDWSITSLNISSLPDGTITFTATITSDGTSATTTTTALKGTTAPSVTIDSTSNPINNTNETNVSVSGGGTAGATVSLVASSNGASANAVTTTVATNGSWSITGLDVSSLGDGTITFTATVTDSFNNSATTTATASNQTATPTITINSASPINSANDTTYSVSGTGNVGATVSLVASNGASSTTPVTATIAANHTWTITGLDLSSLPDGTITFTATITDSFGNTAHNTATAVKGTAALQIAIGSAPEQLNASNDTAVTLTGTGTVGASVSLVASNDGSSTPAVTTTVQANGSWSISGVNVSSLGDGTITFIATISDSFGNTAMTDVTAKANPSVAIVSVTSPIDISNETAVAIAGTGTPGGTISLVAIAGPVATPGDVVTPAVALTTAVMTTVGANGSWSITGLDVSSLPDGIITFEATITDSKGNSQETMTTATKGTAAPTLTIGSTTSPINSSNDTSVSVSGTGVAGATVSLVASNGANSLTVVTTTVGTNGSWSIANINVSSLADGTITFTAKTTDTFGNTAQTTATAAKSTVTPTVSIGSATNPINNANDKAVSISGAGVAGGQISLTATDGTKTTSAYTATVGTDGTWVITGLDASALADGTITFTATITDSFGNTNTATSTATKNTAAPLVTISSTTNPISAANESSVTVSGTGAAGAKVSVIATDGTTTTSAYSAIVGSDGTWSVSGVDVSALADGTVTFTVTIRNSFGDINTATAMATKKTTA